MVIRCYDSQSRVFRFSVRSWPNERIGSERRRSGPEASTFEPTESTVEAPVISGRRRRMSFVQDTELTNWLSDFFVLKTRTTGSAVNKGDEHDDDGGETLLLVWMNTKVNTKGLLWLCVCFMI